MPTRSQRKRGRPPKFGRAADLISLTLPRDVISWLQSIDDDLAWAIVKLHEKATRARVAQFEAAQLVRFPGDRALILVRPELFANLKGVSLIPLSDGRAFLALEPGKGVADLEAILRDRLASTDLTDEQRAVLLRLGQMLRRWKDEGIVFESRSIIVALGRRATTSTALPSLESRRKGAR